jgi:hypothetical protein
MNTFEDSIAYQFDLKMKYRHGSQLWGNMTCYTTLVHCYSGLRCLSWQNICNGKYIFFNVLQKEISSNLNTDL